MTIVNRWLRVVRSTEFSEDCLHYWVSRSVGNAVAACGAVRKVVSLGEGSGKRCGNCERQMIGGARERNT